MSAYIAAACRSPVAPRNGALGALALHELARPVLTATLREAGLEPGQVDEVIVSNALGAGGNPARSVALAAGLPQTVAGLSIDRQCAGGMDAVILASLMVSGGTAEVVIAGGVESYSRRPMRLRTFFDGRPPQPYDQAAFTPWPDRDPDMTQAAADLAARLGISREAQDDWAVDSHAKARAHVSSTSELVPVAGVGHDPFTRRLTSALCARSPCIAGDITAANAAIAADAAAFCVVVSGRIAKTLAAQTTRIVDGTTKGGAVEQPGLAPVAAIQTLMARQGSRPNDFAASEIMEAYAVQAIACVEGAGLDPAAVNPGGGALARGHPIGASGAINVVRLHHELITRKGTGLAAIAAAGGIGSALLLEA